MMKAGKQLVRYCIRHLFPTILTIAAFYFFFTVDAMAQFYQKSYALVIGINKYQYPTLKRKDLNYARKDAESMAALLKTQGFEVIPLYDAQATKTAIIARMQNYLAPRVKSGDRVLVFFAGHGHTETLGGKDWGYIVPYDGGSESATYISMEELQSQSEKMGNATHQLFIMDACYGGLLGTREGGVDPNLPTYLSEVTRRIARQILTAGGKDQQVLDGGPGGHSVFTGVLLEALRDGLADLNVDGYITFAEFCSYVVPRASNRFQTPGPGIFAGAWLGRVRLPFAAKAGAAAAEAGRTDYSRSTRRNRNRSGENNPNELCTQIFPALYSAGELLHGGSQSHVEAAPLLLR